MVEASDLPGGKGAGSVRTSAASGSESDAGMLLPSVTSCAGGGCGDRGGLGWYSEGADMVGGKGIGREVD